MAKLSDKISADTSAYNPVLERLSDGVVFHWPLNPANPLAVGLIERLSELIGLEGEMFSVTKQGFVSLHLPMDIDTESEKWN